MTEKNSPAKSWCFTLNNYTPQEEQMLKDLNCNYVCFGYETSSEGTPHLQGFVTFKKTTRLSALKTICKRAHWEITKCPEAAENYTRKEGNYFIADYRKQGKRTDLEMVVSTLKDGGLKRVTEEHPVEYIKFHSGIEKLANRLTPKRDFKPEVTWLWGPTGIGKTRSVVENEPDLWISGKSLRWWDGYENQEATLFDDFRKDFCTFHELLRILDRYPYAVEVKGGYKQLNSKRMYITSCYPPTDVYGTREDIQQLLRRINQVTEVIQDKTSNRSG